MIRKYSSNQLLSNMSRESKSLEKWKIFSRNSITLTLIFSLTNEYSLNVSCFFFFYTKLDDKKSDFIYSIRICNWNMRSGEVNYKVEM